MSGSVQATALASLAVGAVLGALDGAWLVTTRGLAFETGLDGLLFALGSASIEALLLGALGAVLALAARGLVRADLPSRSIAIPIAAWLAVARALPWIHESVAAGWTPRSGLVFDAAVVLGATIAAAALHRRLAAGPAAPVPAAPGRWAAALLAVAACAVGLRGVLPEPASVLPPVGARPTGTAPLPSLKLPDDTPVILILVDTLRADHLSYAGYERDTSPTLDRLAREGVVFERAIGQATRTSPNMASLVTGTGPATHGLVSARSWLDEGLTTWGEILRDHGYATGAFLANPNMGHRFQFTQGIEHVDETFAEPRHDAGIVLPRALAWLGGQRAEPFFLWLHAIDPHSPYAAPGSARRRYRDDAVHDASASEALAHTPTGSGGVPPSARIDGLVSVGDYVASYDAEIRYFDDRLADFLEGTGELGLPVAPLIVFTSDHGESLGEHDYFFSHGEFTFDATAHVPLILHHPDLPAGLRVSQMVRTIDILPTVLELVGAPVPDSIEGRSLVPLFTRGALPSEPAVIFAGHPGHVEVAVRDDRYKLVARPQRAGWPDAWTRSKLLAWPNARRTSLLHGPRYAFHLFDLTNDPGETNDLAGRLPDVERALRDVLVAATRGANAPSAEHRVSDAQLSDEMRERLEALGYVE